MVSNNRFKKQHFFLRKRLLPNVSNITKISKKFESFIQMQI